MRTRMAFLSAALLAWGATASAATKNGITPIAPRAGASVPAGASPTFRMEVSGSGPVWVHVCRRARRRADGTICDSESIGQARRKGRELRYTPRFYDFAGFWLNRPGIYYWQALRIACVDGPGDCRQEGPVVRFRIR